MKNTWADLARSNPFKAADETPNVEISDNDDIAVMSLEQASYTDRCVIETADGRTIPILVENGTRSVYPIRSQAK